jgi:phage tail-like protein
VAAIAQSATLGMANRFACVIDGCDLGSWTKCTGLSVSFKYDKVAELGEHTTNAFIPGRVEYPAITLQRAMVKSDWDKTKEWLQIVASAPWLLTDNAAMDVAGSVSVGTGGGALEVGGSAGGALMGPSSGKITLFDFKLAEVASWEIQNVLPQAWKGPQFDANGKLVAIETLELVHEGFLVCVNA